MVAGCGGDQPAQPTVKATPRDANAAATGGSSPGGASGAQAGSAIGAGNTGTSGTAAPGGAPAGGTGGGNSAAPGRAINTAYIHKDSQAALVLRPQRIMNSKLWKLAIHLAKENNPEQSPEAMLAEIQKETGIDLAQVEEVVAAGGTMPGPIPLPYFGAVVRFKQPYDQSTAEAKVQAGMAQQAEFNGKKYWKHQDGAVLHFVDATTLIIANEPGLQAMLTAAPGDTSPLIEALRGAGAESDLTAVVMVEPNQVNQLAQMVPPQAQFFLAPVRKMKYLTLHADLSGATLLSLSAKMSDANAAMGVKQLLGQLLGNNPALNLDEMKKQFQSSGLPEELQQELQTLAGELIKGFSIEAQGDTAAVVLKAPPRMAERLEAMAPALIATAKKAAEREKAANNVRQIMLALHNYHDAYGKFPPAVVKSADGKPLYSWRVAILPYLEQGSLYDEFNKQEPWDSEANKKLLQRMPEVFACGISPGEGKANILAVTGPDAAFGIEGGAIFGQVIDGVSNTIGVVQVAADKAVPWTQPADFEVNPDAIAAGLGLAESPTFLAGFLDGSVANLPKTLAPDVLKALFSYKGGEPVNRDDLQ